MSSTFVNLSWIPLDFYRRNGIVRNYWISYGQINESIGGNKTNYLVNDLNKAQFYNFSIQAENQVGVGPPASVNATTLEDGRFLSRSISENTVKTCMSNPLQPAVAFLYPLKTPENLKVF